MNRPDRRGGDFDRRDFVTRNFRGYSDRGQRSDWNNITRNFSANRNLTYQQLTGRRDFDRDWYRGDYRRYGGYGTWGGSNRLAYQYYFPWWAVAPRIGLGLGLGGTGYGWPYWGYGYGGWGGYGGWSLGNYGHAYPSYVYTYPTYNYSTYVAAADAPGVDVPVAPPAAAVQTAQSFVDQAVDAFRAGRFDDAVLLAQHALVDDPRNATAVLLMAQGLMAQQKFDDAAAAMQMAVQTLPAEQWGAVVQRSSEFYPNVQTYTAQLQALENAVRQDANNPALGFLLGHQYGFLGRQREAVEQLDHAINLQPADRGALKLRNTLAAQANLPAREAPPADTNPQAPPQRPQQQMAETKAVSPTEAQLQRSGRFIAAGEQAFASGDYEDAMRNWQHALIDDPNNGGVVSLMAQALFALKQYDSAAGAQQMAMQMLPETEWGSVVQHYTELYPNIEDYTRQLKDLEQVAGQDAENPALRFLLGYHYGFLGYPQQALRELNRALALEPKDQGSEKLRERFAQAQPATRTQ